MSKVWVYADVRPGRVDASALELLTKARALADTVEAVALGPGATDAAGTLGEYGAQAVHASDDEVYADVQAMTGSTLMSNASDVTGLDAAETQIFGGTKIAKVSLGGPDPKLVLMRPKSVAAEPHGDGTANVVPVEVQVPKDVKRARRVERHEEEATGPKLE